ncbi:hypothetical protein QFC22_005461 [Naganishia vaughanmartiniae]|uniref:Uncharacterized protein n=1 Tax=Naganishia vaughanmartiniae TaxID=1424756 RepID=A0ACC2WUP9_9TREE|nr:hypothetical protein QFC22_005461 [Naganishia vaughanmartiniae]
MSGIELVAELKGHTEPAWCVAWNPTRPLLASCSTDKSVRLYTYHFPSSSTDDTTAKPIFTFLSEIPTAHKRTIRSIAWSPSGRTLVTGSFDSTVGIWEQLDERDDAEGIELASGGTAGGEQEDGSGEWECVTTLEGHESECKSVGYSSDGALLASCSRDKSVWVWEVQPDSDFECISVMMEHTQDVKTLAWHPKEEILASASYDASILLFADDPDADWGPFQKLQPSLPAVDPPVAPGIITPDNGNVSTSEQKEARETLPTTDDEFPVPALKDPETIWSLAFSPCGMFLASGGDNGGIRIWARGLSWTSTSESTRDEEDLGRLASTGGDGRILIWQIKKTSETILSSHLSSPVPKISATIVGLQDHAHDIHDINSVAWCRRAVPEDAEEGSNVYARAIKAQRRTRRLLATAADDGSVKVWRATEG